MVVIKYSFQIILGRARRTSQVLGEIGFFAVTYRSPPSPESGRSFIYAIAAQLLVISYQGFCILNLESLAKLHKFLEDDLFRGDQLICRKEVTESRQNELLINKINTIFINFLIQSHQFGQSPYRISKHLPSFQNQSLNPSQPAEGIFSVHNIIFYQMKILTKLRYWNVGEIKFTRAPYKNLDTQDIQYFRTFLKPQHIITDQAQLEFFNRSWNKMQKGSSQLALTPENTQQVSKILEYCNRKKLAVVPQGGNTGLVGGSVPVFDEVVVSTKHMNKIVKFDETSSVLTVEAGVVLEKANQHLSKFGCQVPLDLGAKGSCQLGGNASTNAGGIYMVKHGSFRSHILGMEAVLPNGTILNMESQIHKDNTGYDIKNLFIGGEGTLGMITKLNIHCPRLDSSRRILVFKAAKFEHIIKAIPIIRSKLGQNLNALEYADGQAYITVTKHVKGKFMECAQNEHLLFVETTSEDIEGLLEALPDFVDSVMSNNDKQFRQIWHIRQNIAYASVKEGRMYAYDVSFDVTKWEEMVNTLRAKYPGFLVIGYGHIGDGNIHINICAKQGQTVEIKDEQVFKEVVSKHGSISAEHGVGIYKPKYLPMQKSQAILNIYKQIKSIFDPNGIMNPYKVVQE